MSFCLCEILLLTHQQEIPRHYLSPNFQPTYIHPRRSQRPRFTHAVPLNDMGAPFQYFPNKSRHALTGQIVDDQLNAE